MRKKTQWNWTEEHTAAVQEIKLKLTSDLVLTHPDYNLPFRVTTDSSGHKIGAVLSQLKDEKVMPIAFYSRSLNQTEQRYTTYEKEALAVKFSLRRFRFYILGYEIQVFCDCLPVVHIFKAQECIGKISNFLQNIQEYNATYHYIPGQKYHVADYLSRAPEIEEDNTAFPIDQHH